MDNAATTFVDSRVIDAMLPYFSEEWANPGGNYYTSKRAKAAVNNAKEVIAEIIGAKPSEIYFTSGGTESDNMAIKGIYYGNSPYRNHLITSAIEHKAVLSTCNYLKNQGASVTVLPVDHNGFVSVQMLNRAINRRTSLVSVMMANNEIGTIEDIKAIADVCNKHGVYCHTDAVQCFGHIPINVNNLGIDMMSISSHKLHGPKGVGAIYIKEGTKIHPIIHGGGQENGLRSGTENVAGIVGLMAAAKLAADNMENDYKYCFRLRNYLADELKAAFPDCKINGPDPTIDGNGLKRLPGNLNVSFGSMNGATLVSKLSERGICTSSGSACSQSKKGPSHVLTAIGLDSHMASSALRISLDTTNTYQEVDYLVTSLKEIL